MNPVIIMGVLAVLAIGLALLFRKPSGTVRFSNIAEGIHGDGGLTKLTDAVISGRFRVVKFGTDQAHIAVAVAASTYPIGICTDEADAAERNVNVRIFGNTPGTMRCLLAGTVTTGDELTATTAGGVIKLPVASGTYYPFGRALQDGVSGDTIEFAHMMPIARVVP